MTNTITPIEAIILGEPSANGMPYELFDSLPPQVKQAFWYAENRITFDNPQGFVEDARSHDDPDLFAEIVQKTDRDMTTRLYKSYYDESHPSLEKKI